MSDSATTAAPRPARHGRQGGPEAFLFALAVALAALGPAAGGAEAEDPSLELSVKAAYVYNFTRFVSWPADSPLSNAAAFFIGVLDDEPLAAAVEAAVHGRSFGGRSFVVRRFTTADDVVPCPVLYIGRGQSGSLARLRARLRGWPVLTVSDADGFASRGGVIGLFLEDRRIRFEIAAAAAREAGLGVSSKLLRLSRPEPCSSCPLGSSEER
jgi:hypothetical protein